MGVNLTRIIGNEAKDIGDSISSTISSGITSLENIVGEAKTSLSNLWSGGFVGMSDEGISELKDKLNTYVASVQSIINDFNEKGNIENAFKGQMQDAAQEFIKAIKLLLSAYVSTMKKEVTELDQAYANWKAADTGVRDSINSDAGSIRSQASNISLD